MFHRRRVWCVSTASSAEELADKLASTNWCCCTGFELGGYLFLNDSTSPDGAQEYAVLKKNGGNNLFIQIESMTFGWCDEPEALEFVRETLAGRYDHNSFAREVVALLETPEEHGRCPHCT